jgi:hypothetical protein
MQLNGTDTPDMSSEEMPRPTEFFAVVKHSFKLVTSIIPASWQVFPAGKSV